MEDEELYLPAFTMRRGGIRWPVFTEEERKGNGMDYALQMLQEQRDSASKQKAAEIVQRVKQLHIGEISPGTKVSFVKKFSGDKEFTYLALKVEDGKSEQRWYVTGKNEILTNERFEELLAEKLGFEDFQQLTVISLRLDPTATGPQPETWKGWVGAPTSPKYDTTGWGADVSPPTGSSTHLVGPSEPGEEIPE